jgi:hypothetical protein
MNRSFCMLVLLLVSTHGLLGQCFTSSGNPVGGTSNMGVMDKRALRAGLFYSYSSSDKYFQGHREYTGDNEILQNASYNYLGFFSAYGLAKWLSMEMEAGYYLDKTQLYYLDDTKLSGQGFSNLVLSLKPRLFYSSDKRFELSCALGVNIPFSREMQQVSGVTLPIQIQPSIGSYGLVFQSFMVKEYPFRAIRFFWVYRMEGYFENPQEYIPGCMYINSLFVSRHFTFEQWKLKDWTLILQLRNQVQGLSSRSGEAIGVSGNCLLYLVPQLNLSLGDHWNISVLADLPLYRYYHGIQLANKTAIVLSLIRDFSFTNN